MLRRTRGLSVAKSRKMLIRDVSKGVGRRAPPIVSPLSISPKSQLPMQRRRSMVRNKYGLASITKDRDFSLIVGLFVNFKGLDFLIV